MVVRLSKDAGAIFQSAADEALNRNHELIEPLHILWAIYHHQDTSQTQQVIDWLEAQDVDSDQVRAEFQSLSSLSSSSSSSSSFAPVNVRQTHLNPNHTLDLAPALHRSLEYATILSVHPDQVLNVEDVVYGLLSHGQSPVLKLLKRCSGQEAFEPIWNGDPDSQVRIQMTRIPDAWRESMTRELNHIRMTFDEAPSKEAKESRKAGPVLNSNPLNLKPVSRSRGIRNLRIPLSRSSSSRLLRVQSLRVSTRDHRSSQDSTTGALYDSEIAFRAFGTTDSRTSNVRLEPMTSLRGTTILISTEEDDAAPLDVVDSDLVDSNLSQGLLKNSSSETLDWAGKIWRWGVTHLILWRNDRTNALRLSRGLQLSLAYLSGHEAQVLDQIINELLRKPAPAQERSSSSSSPHQACLRYQALALGFRHRNLSRILVQTLLAPRFDVLWHHSTRLTFSRVMDFVLNDFPATENNLSGTPGHASNSVLRRVLGKGRWLTRVLSGGREALATDERSPAAQNLAAEGNGFERANRLQFGTSDGRERTNDFRQQHRLPVDESIVRTFVTAPDATMVNNGLEHVLRCLVKHWQKLLCQDLIESQNFAHQRMELLDPFEMLRFHMPIVLTQCCALRGLCLWDQQILAPFIRRLETIEPISRQGLVPIRQVLVDFDTLDIISSVCGGIHSRVEPLTRLIQALASALSLIEVEARAVYELVSSVEFGLQCGHHVMHHVRHAQVLLPKDQELQRAIHQFILHSTTSSMTKGETTTDIDNPPPPAAVDPHLISRALLLLSPKDKRTYIDLVQKGHGQRSHAAQLISRRVCKILKREIQRANVSRSIQALSKGDVVEQLEIGQHYWISRKRLELEAPAQRVYIYTGPDSESGIETQTFVDKITRARLCLTPQEHVHIIQTYVPMAESISLAQKAWMTFELEHGKRFHANAFMEFLSIREALKKLTVLGQMHCEELDDARLNLLTGIQEASSSHSLDGPHRQPQDHERKGNDEKMRLPQSMIVIGAGPSGLLTTIHCIENVLISGGHVSLFEARDAFSKGASTFERAQVVRLDARWIAMLRYHVGMIFEDIFIPLSGESNAHIGNTLPSEGFVEITIKDLENMLHIVVAKLLSRKLLSHVTESGAKYNVENNSLVKMGKALKKGDLVYRSNVNSDGQPNDRRHNRPLLTSWKVIEVAYRRPLKAEELQVGQSYLIYMPKTLEKDPLRPFQLISFATVKEDMHQLSSSSSSCGIKILTFKPEIGRPSEMKANTTLEIPENRLPSIYPLGTQSHSEILHLVLQCETIDDQSNERRTVTEKLAFEDIANQEFDMDIGHTSVVEAIGKPVGSSVHFQVTPSEPYGVCCLGSAKVSMNMHYFGNSRWGNGLVDDIRSFSDSNTRVVGDFTKNVSTIAIAEIMHEAIMSREWMLHFEDLLRRFCTTFSDDNQKEMLRKIQSAVHQHAKDARHYRRKNLQTRSFETGDNSYLGMELTREYSVWKNTLVDEIAAKDKDIKRIFAGQFDRLFFHGALETMRRADVYNPGAKNKIPRFYLIDSLEETSLGDLAVGETFLLYADDDDDDDHLQDHRVKTTVKQRFEILDFLQFQRVVLVRDMEGHIRELDRQTRVCRGGNLTRGPCGELESKVALASFPLAHYVNVRTMRMYDREKGLVFAFVGDEQSTPHFMRYSGLTGAAINAMEMNTFIRRALTRDDERFRDYADVTNWSNGEVVTRGIGAGYGQDGFLRPGFTYTALIEYLVEKLLEMQEMHYTKERQVLSREWKLKFASGLIPRKLEQVQPFIQVLRRELRRALIQCLVSKSHATVDVDFIIKLKERVVDSSIPWTQHEWTQLAQEVLRDSESSSSSSVTNSESLGCLGFQVDSWCHDIIVCAETESSQGRRISSESTNQPKSVDSVIDAFAIEAQGFSNGLTISITNVALALAFRLEFVHLSLALGFLSTALALRTIVIASRYKNRNERAQEVYHKTHFSSLVNQVFDYMSIQDQANVRERDHPRHQTLTCLMDQLEHTMVYHNQTFPREFKHLRQRGSHFTPLELRAFVDRVQLEWIPQTYHDEPYIKDCLVCVWTYLVHLIRVVHDDHVSGETLARSKSGVEIQAASLFHHLMRFEARVAKSTEGGRIQYGWHKNRHIRHQHLSAIANYVVHLIVGRHSQLARVFRVPLSVSIQDVQSRLSCFLAVLRESRPDGHNRPDDDSTAHPEHPHVQVELNELKLATIENYKTSLIILAGWISFTTGVLFSFGQILELEWLGELARASFGFLGCIPILLALELFFKQLGLLRAFQDRIWHKVQTEQDLELNKYNDRVFNLITRLIQHVKIITLGRISAATCVGMALLASIILVVAPPPDKAQAEAQALVVDSQGTLEVGSKVFAISALVFMIGSWIVDFVTEYHIRHGCDPKCFGQAIQVAFDPELRTLFHRFRDNKDYQAIKTTGEYVSRAFLHQYRFDTILDANRLGSILQSIQGMDGPFPAFHPEIKTSLSYKSKL